ncbi:MAG: hypothetical protein PWQ77_957 [Kosmotogales bacterium]|nr:hypothetical protein [Kosmotogales bacterium]
MNGVVVYYSRTGNTEKIAKVISEEIKGQEYNLKMFDKSEISLNEIDTLFVGSGIYGGKLDNQVKDFILSLNDKPYNIAVFITRAGIGKAYINEISDFIEKARNNGNKACDDFFECYGKGIIFHRKYPRQEDFKKVANWVKNIDFK